MSVGKFYKYIVKNGSNYKIQKDNESYGTYSKLSDALYERDRLIKADWNWDDSLQLEETENHYERMNLPRFIHEFSYIFKKVQKFKIMDGNGREQISFNTKKDAYNYAETTGGTVVETEVVYRVMKKINGKLEYFGQFKTIDEAKKKRDELIKNGWKK